MRRMTTRLPALLAALGLSLGAQGGAAEPQSVVSKGLRIDFSIVSADPAADGAAAQTLTEGQYAEVRFEVTDEETGAPVSPLEPAVWIGRMTGSAPISCRDQLSGYLQGMLATQADVDLNKYFILVLNDDRSISVIDPMLGVSGITQLYTMILLERRGEDWARSPDEQHLYVTMPEAGKVAVADLSRFRVTRNVEAGRNPVRIEVQPDGRYLWVGNDASDPAESGVTVLDARTLEVAGRIPTGPGHHEIAFSADGLKAFVTNAGAANVSVIDVQKLAKEKDLPVGAEPVAVAVSPLSGAAYVAATDGSVMVVDGSSGEVSARLETGGGLAAFSLDPSGRWGFVASAQAGRVDVIDTSSNAIVHRFAVDRLPHQFAFTDTYAYVRHLGSSQVTLVPLAQLSRRDKPGLQTVSLGSRAPGEYPYPAAAESISPTGEWTAVLAANPADKMVYYYMEGMVAPMGSYSTYGRVPRAVSVVDRSVREVEKGVYAARFRIPADGQYSVAFLLDSPFVNHCFAFEAAADAELEAHRHATSLKLDFVVEERRVPAGQPLSVRFLLTRPDSDEPVSGLRDVTVLATRPPGNWQERRRASSLGFGLYEVSVPADEPGVYYLSVAVPSLGIDFTELPHISFMAVPPAVASQGGSKP